MPDLNSIPASPRQTTISNPPSTSIQPRPSTSRQNSSTPSRRASQIYPMSPPPLPLASPGGTVSQQHSTHHTSAFPPLSPSLNSSSTAAAGYVDANSAPMRHPRPMTAAEMHLELEKEQEAVVNRLTRELSALRAHSASVASTASISSSSASGALLDASGEHNTTAGMLSSSSTSGIFPTSGRRHRSSSSVSRSAILTPASISGSYPHRYSISSQQSAANVNATSDPSSTAHRDREHRSSSIVSTPRYEEVAMQKAELEEVKRENEVLKERIRELERKIRGGREGASNGSGEERGRTGRAGDESTA